MPPANHIPQRAARLRVELGELAASLGFALCRIAPAVPPPRAAAFRQWLAEGCHAGMGWMTRHADLRADPQTVLPGAKSIVMLAMSYAPQRGALQAGAQGESQRAALQEGGQPQRGALSAVEPPPEIPAIARYARGDDYHELIRPRLRRIEAFLAAHGGTQRGFTDSGPVAERDFAAMAGLGWQGKSTMLIHPRLGAWFFVAEVLTSLPLPPDAPLLNRCGACTRCLDACPTGAISRERPHRLDARCCVAYLTIEHKGPIPEPLRPLIGGRVYGCDACAGACPWNRFASDRPKTADGVDESTASTAGFPPLAPLLTPRPILLASLREWLLMDEAAFRAAFRGSPILRIKHPGWRRNVCVALGNTGTPDDLPALESVARETTDATVAEHARWAMARVRGRWGM